ncbi:hypothetical protein BS17DRAFT_775335 [Gyrodon lividus]|nr:hypothetical protein BS17DRAFT_775335 [Gyrodon lividus]
MVHCPSDCAHETCYRQGSTPVINLAEDVGPRYVDASVSPIITITGRIESTRSPIGDRSVARSPSDEGVPYTLFGLTQAPYVSHKNFAPEADVRSPISKGTMVPMTVAEPPLARPSPPVQVSNMQNYGLRKVVLM